jgi:hypothetical protein
MSMYTFLSIYPSFLPYIHTFRERERRERDRRERERERERRERERERERQRERPCTRGEEVGSSPIAVRARTYKPAAVAGGTVSAILGAP